MLGCKKTGLVWSTALTDSELEAMGAKAATLLNSRKRKARAHKDRLLLDESGTTLAEYSHSVRMLGLDTLHYLIRNHTARSPDLRLCIQSSLPQIRSLDIPPDAALTITIQTMVHSGMQMSAEDIDNSVETEWFWHVCGIIGQTEHSRLARLGVPLKHMVMAADNDIDPELIRSLVG